MLEILSNPVALVKLLFLVFAMVLSIITFIRTGNLKTTLKTFIEVNEMSKYKTVDSNSEIDHSQTFSPYRDKYILNPDTNELEKLPVQENVQEMIQSCVETCLERALEKYLPKNVENDDMLVADYTQQREDLGAIGEAMEIAEEYRERFNLPDSYSMAQIYDYVDKQAKALKQRISDVTKQSNDNKEANNNGEN